VKAHTCYNCGLLILPEEAEVEVDLKAVAKRRRKAGLFTDPATSRYRHASYEVCAAREAKVAAWNRREGVTR
jgi:hypothetical protein